jgi:pyruvate/2-oxoglutarate dehydrogenase complex dihydrolipoamide acyltransferase (E2) component
VGKDAVAIGALLGAIAGAALGAYVQKLWTSELSDADDFGQRLAKLEAEIEELELLQRERKRKSRLGPAAARPAEAPQAQSTPEPQASRPQPTQRQRLQPESPRRQPSLEVRGKPPEQQYLVLSADRNFTLSRVDYVSNQGTTVTSEDVKKSGSRIEVPINEKKVSRIWYLVQRVNAEPAAFQFRCHLSLDGVETESVVPAVIQQNFMQTRLGRTIFRKVTLAPAVADLSGI